MLRTNWAQRGRIDAPSLGIPVGRVAGLARRTMMGWRQNELLRSTSLMMIRVIRPDLNLKYNEDDDNKGTGWTDATR